VDANIKPNYSNEDSIRLKQLKQLYKDSFNRLTLDEEKTLEFYYKLGETRGVDGYQYVNEAINRAIMKQNLSKPISYIASLCKNFYKNGLHSQPFQEENDLINYVESKIGKLSFDNKKLIQSAISTNGSVRVMAASAEVLNNSEFQSKIIEEIILKVVDIFGRPSKAKAY
jgi:hypothetical protein